MSIPSRNFFLEAVFEWVMKTTYASILAICIFSLSSLSAQTNQPAPPNGDNPPAQACRHHKKWLANLTDAEKTQLKSDLKQIHDDPQLVAAREAVKAAQTKEARQEARKTIRQTRAELLLKVDPSIQPVLDKISVSKNPN